MKPAFFVTRLVHRLVLPLLAVAALGLPTSAAQVSIRPVNLRCENLADPLGLDVRSPSLSWQLAVTDATERGQGQTAWEMRVASSPDHLQANTADLWKSGWRESDAAQRVIYQGRPLSYGALAYWQVRVRDESGRASPWSEVARWSLGPLEPADWSARWIGADQVFERGTGWPPPDNTLPDPWLRQTVDLPREASQALLYVASVGYHEVYVNGRRVGDRVLEPCVSDHTQRARYVTYDLREHLRPGRNAIGLWLGTAWSIFPPYQTTNRPARPIVLAQADIVLTDGRRIRLVTDETWRVHPSPNTLLGVWDFMHYGGELYDARREMPDWCGPDLDTASWSTATVVDPALGVSAARVEPNRQTQEIRPSTIDEVWPGTYRIDMGVNFAGWVEVPVRGAPGDRIEFLWSERPDQEMTHRLHSVYVVGPSGSGVFCNRFNYGSGRWLTVKGLKTRPEKESIRGWPIRTDYARTGRFRCSDALLNQIYETTLWTFENLSLGGYVVDCPQRERMGYGGDAHATVETALDHYGLAAFYAKWAEDWRDVQGKESAWGVGTPTDAPGAGGPSANDGNLPYTAPTYWGGGGPAWSGFCVTLPWEVYRRQGDLRILEDNFRTIERWLTFLETKAADSLLQRWGGKWDYLGDWLWPGAEGVNGDTRETLFFNNCYWIYNLETAAKIADALDREPAALAWRARAHQVRQAVHREFFNPADASYVNGFQAYLAIALLTGVPPLELRDAVAARLEHEILTVRKGHFWGGITGGYFIIKQLIESDRIDLLHTMMAQQDYPGWADMLQRGATTIWEDWEGAKSLLHSSYLHIGMAFSQGLAGIRPGLPGPGGRRWIIRPGIWANCPLDQVQGTVQSPYGTIESAWRRQGEGWRFNVTIPPGAMVEFQLPTALRGLRLSEGGRPLAKVRGVEGVRVGPAGETVVALLPGRYELDAQPE